MFLRAAVVAGAGSVRRCVGATLHELDSIVTNLRSLTQLRTLLARRRFDLVILEETYLPDLAEDLPPLLRESSAAEVVILGAQNDPATHAAFLAAGCFAVLPADVGMDALQECLKTVATRRLDAARTDLQEIPGEEYTLADYATTSPAMRTFLKAARRAASQDTTLLLTGETGVGKGVLARALHNEGPRLGPFLAVSCAALNEHLLESELFGHRKGAFTGADKDRRGYFELAHEGTLFLDEIGELPLHLQVKLLRAIEEREIQPVGSTDTLKVNVRFIAATNRDLEREVTDGRFRKDLFYRLNVMTLRLPALRDRAEDIAEISQSYVDHYRVLTHADVTGISTEAVHCLRSYPWPGNIRELSNAIERAVIMSTADAIRVEDLPVAIQEFAPLVTDIEPDNPMPADAEWLPLKWAEVRRRVLDTAEHRYLTMVLAHERGKISAAAKHAGMDPRSLSEKMKKYGLKKEDFRHKVSG